MLVSLEVVVVSDDVPVSLLGVVAPLERSVLPLDVEVLIVSELVGVVVVVVLVEVSTFFAFFVHPEPVSPTVISLHDAPGGQTSE